MAASTCSRTLKYLPMWVCRRRSKCAPSDEQAHPAAASGRCGPGVICRPEASQREVWSREDWPDVVGLTLKPGQPGASTISAMTVGILDEAGAKGSGCMARAMQEAAWQALQRSQQCKTNATTVPTRYDLSAD